MAGYANMNPEDLRFLLAALARAHHQKLQLVLFTNLPLIGVEAPAKPVFETMNTAQGELEKELTSWAKKHNVDLAFQFPNDVPSQA
jgi:hypothetical protein